MLKNLLGNQLKWSWCGEGEIAGCESAVLQIIRNEMINEKMNETMEKIGKELKVLRQNYRTI